MKGILGNKIRTIVCVGCGQSVTRRATPRQKYCSLPCYRLGARPTRKTGSAADCEQCGTRFYAAIGRADSARFCSLICQNAWQGRRKDRYSCKTCARTFRRSPSAKIVGRPTYCSLACRDADPQRSAMLIGMNVAQAKLRPNHLERAAYAVLNALGVEYEAQRLIGGKFCVDAFVPAVGLVIQFDGDYWHGNPERFPAPDSRQLRRMKLDASQDAYMRACGYGVLRLWETDIRKRPDHIREALRLALLTRTAGYQAPSSDQVA